MKSLVEQFVDDKANMRLFQQERAIYEVTDLIESAMSEAGISRSELAKMLGKSKAWITQLLDGEGNKTFRTVADVLAVLGKELHSTACNIAVGKASETEEVATATYKPQWMQTVVRDWNPEVRLPKSAVTWAGTVV